VLCGVPILHTITSGCIDHEISSLCVKVGDLVRMRFSSSIDSHDLTGKSGIITELSDPTPVMPYRVATIAFGEIVCDGIPSRMLEVISENR